MELSESKTASNRIQELNLMSQGRHKYQVRLYYNKLEPRHREKLPHSHLPMEIDWFGSGCYGTYIINGKKYSIEPGDVFVLRSKEEHSIIHLEDGDNCICTGLQFSPDFVWSPNNELGEMREVYSLFSNTNKTFKHKFGANESHAPEIRVAIREIVQEFEERRPEYSLMVKARLICLLIMFVRECGPISRGGVVTPLLRGKIVCISRML